MNRSFPGHFPQHKWFYWPVSHFPSAISSNLRDCPYVDLSAEDCSLFLIILIVPICAFVIFTIFFQYKQTRTACIPAAGSPGCTQWHNNVLACSLFFSQQVCVFFAFFFFLNNWANIFRELVTVTPTFHSWLLILAQDSLLCVCIQEATFFSVWVILYYWYWISAVILWCRHSMSRDLSQLFPGKLHSLPWMI